MRRGQQVWCERCWQREEMPSSEVGQVMAWSREWVTRHAECEPRPCCRVCLATEGLVGRGKVWLCGACAPPGTRVEVLPSGLLCLDRRRTG